jgi:hypothetical protein
VLIASVVVAVVGAVGWGHHHRAVPTGGRVGLEVQGAVLVDAGHDLGWPGQLGQALAAGGGTR